ncbi:CU044_2847 family protein [Sphaerisporangium sp. TRM90804]|uniref:CU044_2847 family protein n=1 Tax=Sphaerisporangium sp. TRM90804 TaxID=3031113 RepID=UPI00244D1930|nr:CU044_2847 family protein [Sphaerisporangium sp. TRM90804]MDH2424031.1 CU044_2847 family protein [Sphaerisporangium sp. TRM90804]
MQQLVEVALPDGQTIWARVSVQPGPRDSGLFDGAVRTVKGFDTTLRAVAANVREAVAGAGPEQVSVEFGIEVAVGKDGLVAALAGASGTATLKVCMSWSSPPQAEAGGSGGPRPAARSSTG